MLARAPDRPACLGGRFHAQKNAEEGAPQKVTCCKAGPIGTAASGAPERLGAGGLVRAAVLQGGAQDDAPAYSADQAQANQRSDAFHAREPRAADGASAKNRLFGSDARLGWPALADQGLHGAQPLQVLYFEAQCA